MEGDRREGTEGEEEGIREGEGIYTKGYYYLKEGISPLITVTKKLQRRRKQKMDRIRMLER